MDCYEKRKSAGNRCGAQGKPSVQHDTRKTDYQSSYKKPNIMNEPNHTPLPWIIFDDIYQAANGRYIDEIHSLVNGHILSVYGYTEEEVKANRVFVVKAVNNHDKLVEALKMCHALMDLSLTHMNIWDNPKGINPELREALEKYSEQALATLKEVEQ